MLEGIRRLIPVLSLANRLLLRIIRFEEFNTHDIVQVTLNDRPEGILYVGYVVLTK